MRSLPLVALAATASIVAAACGGSTSTPPAPAPASTSAAAPAPPADPPLGATCTYHEIPGTATITAVTSGRGTCADAVTVTFDFTPTDATAASRYRFPDFSDGALTWDGPTGDRLVSASCVATLGLHVGSVVPARRREIEQGDCPAARHDLDVEASRCAPPCSR